jgi:hypothetical protein
MAAAVEQVSIVQPQHKLAAQAVLEFQVVAEVAQQLVVLQLMQPLAQVVKV